MNMSMKSILIRIIMDLISLKILKQHLLVQQKKTTIRPKLHPATEIESTSEEILKIVMLQKCPQQNLVNII